MYQFKVEYTVHIVNSLYTFVPGENKVATFLILYFAVYLLLHLYGFSHAYRSLAWGRKATVFAAVFSFFMIAAPILVRVVERQGMETAARLLAFIAYTWMGLLFLFVSVALFYDIFALFAWLLKTLRGKSAAMPPAARRKRFTAQLVIVLLVYGYGIFEANQVRTTHLTITTPKVSKRISRFRIAQISDVHLGLLVRKQRLEKILANVREADPDLLVSTGDLVDGQPAELTAEQALLNEISPPFGKLAIVGNHEVYAGLARSLDFLAGAGFLPLRDESIRVNGILFAGVDDPAAADPEEQKKPDMERRLLQQLNGAAFTVLLKHRPVTDPKSVGLFDIQLSGHTHKGQIFPFTIVTRLAYSYPAGMNMLEYGYLYVTSGSGTWGPPIRFIAPPEVVIIDLVPQS